MASKFVIPPDLESFTAHLLKSKRVFSLCGAGLSASSGLATFRGAGGLWRNHDAMSLATQHAFDKDPSLVWQFYNLRRIRAFNAKPNLAHYALAEYARKNKDFITVTQNVDGLSPRAHHPSDQLYMLHGSLSTLKCTSFYCDYIQTNNFSSTLTPALTLTSDNDVTAEDTDEQPPTIPPSELPQCPACRSALLRPGIVWFGESLPSDILTGVEEWLDDGDVDLCLVIGTSGRVYPAADYIWQCRERGAKVAIINLDISGDPELGGVEDGDWLFEGDAATILAEILKPVIGEITLPEQGELDELPKPTAVGGPVNAWVGSGIGRGKAGGGSGYY